MTSATGKAKVVRAVRFGPSDFRHLRRIQKRLGTANVSDAIRHALKVAADAA